MVSAFLCQLMFAQGDRGAGVKSAVKKIDAEQKFALVIGNANYDARIGKLDNPLNDASDMTDILRSLGFEIIPCKNKTGQIIPCSDLDKRSMESAIRDYGQKLKESPNAIGLFYYAGHGMQLKGQNYLLPVTAEIHDETDVSYEAVSLDFLLEKIAAGNSPLNFVILDACRNNPFPNWQSAGNKDISGLAKPSILPRNTMFIYSAELNKTANDGNGRNGLFTKYLLKHIATPDLDYAEMVRRIKDDVLTESGQTQNPWMENIPSKGFYFNKQKSEATNNSERPQQQPFNGVLSFIPIPEINIKTAEQIAQLGEELRKKEDVELAIKNFDDAIRLNPDSDFAYSRRGECYRVLGNNTQAIADLNEAIRRNPKNVYAYASRGVAYRQNGRNDLAFNDLNEALRLDKDEYWSYYSRGDLYLQIKNCQRALGDLSQSIALNPKYVFSYLSRSEAYLCEQNTAGALIDLNTALRLDPNNAEGYLIRARLFTRLKRVEEAKADYRTLIKLEPQEAESYSLVLAVSFFKETSYQDTLSELTRLIKLNGKHKVIALSFRGMTYLLVDNMKAAQEDMDLAVRLAQKDEMDLAAAYFFRSFYYIAHKKYKNATEDIDAIFKIKFTDDDKKTAVKAIAHTARSLFFLRKEKYDMALNEINAALTISPRLSFLYELRASIYEEMGRNTEAENDRAMALQINDYNSL